MRFQVWRFFKALQRLYQIMILLIKKQNTTLPSDNALNFKKNEKINIADNNRNQNKTQQNLERQTAKIPALSSGNIGKYQFLAVEDVLS